MGKPFDAVLEAAFEAGKERGLWEGTDPADLDPRPEYAYPEPPDFGKWRAKAAEPLG